MPRQRGHVSAGDLNARAVCRSTFPMNLATLNLSQEYNRFYGEFNRKK